MKNDFDILSSFFIHSAYSNVRISRELLEFCEHDQIAKNANKMLEDKINAQKEILREKKLLQESEANLRSIFEAAENVAFLKTDCNGVNSKILDFSPGAELIFGYKKEEIIGKPIAILHNEEDIKEIPKIQEMMSIGKKGFSRESILIRKSGKEFPALFTTYPVFDKEKKMIATIEVSIDITERKEIEEELQKMTNIKSIGLLAGGIAHDFNNILTSVFGNMFLAKSKLPENHPAAAFLEESKKSMERAKNLTTQLLTFSKGGSPIKKDISLQTLIKETVIFNLSGSKIKPAFEFHENLWLAKADQKQMEQVFSNLTRNAKEAMSNGGDLYIEAENIDDIEKLPYGVKEGKYILIKCIDKGIGIKNKYLHKIFDPYFTTKRTGHGLGLATTYSIIEKHGGKIMVDSEEKKGTTFTIYLPATDSKQIELTDQSDKTTEKTKQKAEILVMDDEEMIAKLVKDILKSVGHSVTITHNGEEALKIYKEKMNSEKPFDAVILDLTIRGGMGGKETIKELLKINPEIKAIVSSGYADDPVLTNYPLYGFKSVIEKPYSLEELKKVITKVLA
ncbi:MAG: PAS domain S-box protein [Verrucomicrobiota bacterium]|nr:PAS domain S-box protein [Verrucomicrobiota bacterium]